MKKLLLILSAFIVIICLIVAAVFGMRFYNNEKYGWDEEEGLALHDYENYPDTFEDGTIDHFASGNANGFHLLPEEPVNAEPIVVFGGSEGSSNFDLAVQLATEGYEVYSLFFFGADNQPEELNRIPLEFFEDFLDHADLMSEEITVIGVSKGAELGLVLTNYYEEINNLVLYAPSRYVFTGLELSGDVGSSWTWQGNDLPYINIVQSDFGAFIQSMFDMLVSNPMKYRETHESAIDMAENRDEARIDTSNFDGQALLLAGGQDTLWPADTAAQKIGEALGNNAEVVIYDDAGHLFDEPPYLDGWSLGGTVEANNAAEEDSDEEVFQFLEEHSER